MNDFIRQATPLALALFLGLIGVAAVLISQGAKLASEKNSSTRRKAAFAAIVAALPPNLCRSALSYDIWVVTTLFASDPKTLGFYNITDKHSAIQLLIVIHLILFLFVASWGGLVRKGDDTGDMLLEVGVSLFAVLLCVLFQVY